MNNKSIIAGAVSLIKADFGGIFERQGLKRICQQSGCKWRERILPPARTVELLLIQILYGNTAISHLRHIVGLNFSASAFCQARAPVEVLKIILEKLGKRFIKNNGDKWLGHRTFLIDGSSFSTPDTGVLEKHFSYPPGQKAGCGCVFRFQCPVANSHKSGKNQIENENINYRSEATPFASTAHSRLFFLRESPLSSIR